MKLSPTHLVVALLLVGLYGSLCVVPTLWPYTHRSHNFVTC
jgi:hypothetical protein